MKKKVLLSMLCLSIMAVTSYNTVAYFIADVRTTNIVTMPSLDLDLNEMMKNGTELVEYPVDTIQGVMPGRTISKIPYINNTGDEDFYTRVYIKTHIYDSAGNEINPEEEIININIDHENWVTDENIANWYYYKNIVKSGTNQVLAPFTKVKFSEDMGNEYKNAKVEIEVYAQAVQAKNNEVDLSKQSILEVQGWADIDMTEVSK